MNSMTVWTSESGLADTGSFDLQEDEFTVEYEPEAHCFVCNRHTDHFGEHDDLVDAGQARYDFEWNAVYYIALPLAV